ncbi:MAG: hypothetical protein MZV64_10845 [Ignavibacteriales bacterium]|nr:hypothetical protein [Ignavibacteriales bacterium]
MSRNRTDERGTSPAPFFLTPKGHLRGWFFTPGFIRPDDCPPGGAALTWTRYGTVRPRLGRVRPSGRRSGRSVSRCSR